MTEAQIQLQNALTTTFLANLAFLSEYDNELLINSQYPNNIKLFLKEIKNKKTVKIIEFLFDDKNSVLKDTKGLSYRQEIILPLYADEI